MSNSVRVLHALRRSPGLSKTELARTLGISPATSGVIVAGLVEAGLVISAGWNPSSVGRRSERLSLNPDGGCVLGVDLSESEIRFGVLDLAGRVRSRASVAFPRTRHRAKEDAVVETIVAQVRELPMPIAHIGLAVPGIVDPHSLVIRRAVNLGWHDVDLAARVAERVDVPVRLEQNLKAALLAEEWWGGAQLADPAVLLMLGSGVGVAVRVGGAMVNGATGMAGEIGHVPLSLDGPLCACGQRGCFEAYASGPALRARYKSLVRRHGGSEPADTIPIGDIVRAARREDPAATQALDEHARYLGQGVVMVLNIINPQVVLLGDEVMEAGELLLPRVREYAAAHALPDAVEAARIGTSTFDGEGSLVGAATVALDGLFTRLAM